MLWTSCLGSNRQLDGCTGPVPPTKSFDELKPSFINNENVVFVYTIVRERVRARAPKKVWWNFVFRIFFTMGAIRLFTENTTL